MNKILYTRLWISGIIVLIGVGVVWGEEIVAYLQLDDNVVESQPISQMKEIPEQPLLNENNIDISDWKTYRNEEYGIEFKYPAQDIIQLDGNGNLNLYHTDQINTSRNYLEISKDSTNSVEQYIHNLENNIGPFTTRENYKNGIYLHQLGFIDGVSYFLIFIKSKSEIINIYFYGSLLDSQNIQYIIDSIELL